MKIILFICMSILVSTIGFAQCPCLRQKSHGNSAVKNASGNISPTDCLEDSSNISRDEFPYTTRKNNIGMPQAESPFSADHYVMTPDMLANGGYTETIDSTTAPPYLGKHKIKFDGTGFPSGIYFNRINIGKLSETKKKLELK